MSDTAIDKMTEVLTAFRRRPGMGHTKALIEGVGSVDQVRIITANEQTKRDAIPFIYRDACVSLASNLDQKFAGYEGALVLDNYAFCAMGDGVLAQYMELVKSHDELTKRLRVKITENVSLKEEAISERMILNEKRQCDREKAEQLQKDSNRRIVELSESLREATCIHNRKWKDDQGRFTIEEIKPLMAYVIFAIALLISIGPLITAHIELHRGISFFHTVVPIALTLGISTWGLVNIMYRIRHTTFTKQIKKFRKKIL